jgi:L-ascorbate metabolism protein UlaG (beta-lactamase superfamily)
MLQLWIAWESFSKSRRTGLLTASLLLMGATAACPAQNAAPGGTSPLDSSSLPQPILEKTSGGDLAVRPLKHGSVLVVYKNKNYYIDPSALPAGIEYPKADVILVTHEHGDHCDSKTIQGLKKEGTIVIANARSVEKLGFGEVMRNGDKRKLGEVIVEAVPAYNIVRSQFHPKGRDNGYVLTFGGKRVYFAGDTEATPEMKNLEKIDIAFLPINLPYTMPPKEAAEAAKAFKPKMLVPYHQGQSDPQEVLDALKETGITVKVLRLP